MSVRPRLPLLLALFCCSGAAALGYQMVWVRMSVAGLGHEAPAMIAVTGAFLGGMALGAWLLDERISKSSFGERWFAGLELTIGLWGLASALLIPLTNRVALSLMGTTPGAVQQWFVTFALPLLALLPATAAMGATFPAMNHFLVTFAGQQRIGAIYGANTFGAVLGVVASVFVLMPALGFRGSLVVLAVLNFACGALAFACRGRQGGDPLRKNLGPSSPLPSPPLGETRNSPGYLYITLFFTGLLGIGYELVGVRVLAQVLENTIFSYAAVLAVYLAGTALGAGLYQRLGQTRPFRSTLTFLLFGIAVSCTVGIRLLALTPNAYDALRHVTGDNLGSVVLSETLVAAMVFALPTLFMGATFSHLVQAISTSNRKVGRAVGINTLGCAAAALIIGVLALPALGAKWTLAILTVSYLAFLPDLKRHIWIALLFPALVFAFLPSTLILVDLPEGAKIRAHREGIMASVAVIETEDGHRTLRVNNRSQMGGTAAAIAEKRQAHIPLLLHPAPKRALFLGPGTGITLGAAGVYPGLESEGVELIPEVRALMPHFEPENGGSFPRPGLQVTVADARRFVRTTTNRYDVIVADVFHPALDGAGFLYTQDHFQAVRERLAPGGLFCQWLPLHQLDETVLRSIVQTFLQTFSQARAFLLHFNVDVPVLALVGSADDPRMEIETLESRLKHSALQPELRRAGLERSLNLLGCFAAGPDELKRFAGGAPAATDDQPFVLFAAPRFAVQRRSSPPHQLLLDFLRECAPDAKSISAILGGNDEGYRANLASFISARDIYLRGLVQESEGNLGAAIDLYLESAARSLHFTPSYARCVTIVQLFEKTDRARAMDLFQRLEKAQPNQPLGRRLLGPLFENVPSQP